MAHGYLPVVALMCSWPGGLLGILMVVGSGETILVALSWLSCRTPEHVSLEHVAMTVGEIDPQQ